MAPVAGKDTRRIALAVLNSLSDSRRTLDLALEEALNLSTPLCRRDRSLVVALVYGVLRWRGRIDWIISCFSKTPLKKIDPQIFNILRLGVFQIVFLDRIPPSAAVHTAVELAKAVAAPWTAGFVNAVLRNVARGHAALTPPSSRKDPIKSLCVTHAFPAWLISRWLDRFGLDETRALCGAINTMAPLTLRTNTLSFSRQQLLSRLTGAAGAITPTRYAPDGICLWQVENPVTELPGFAQGGFQVQDEAAQLVSLMLAPRPGETVLDACAGLGTKTGHIAQLMNNCGRILAMDLSGEKLQRLQDEMKRLGIGIVSTLVHDLQTPVRKRPAPEFDRVLLDAPCSGLGVLRRNPDTKWSVLPRHLGRLQARQKLFLANVAPLVRPGGGTLVYAVCSQEPEETESVITDFLNHHQDFAIQETVDTASWESDPPLRNDGRLQPSVHRHGMDAFFAVAMVKR